MKYVIRTLYMRSVLKLRSLNRTSYRWFPEPQKISDMVLSFSLNP